MLTDDEERELRQELLKMDVNLRRKQVDWETPRNIAILAGALAALFGAAGGFRSEWPIRGEKGYLRHMRAA